MSRLKWFIAPLFLISLDVFASPKGCQNLSECVDTVGRLTQTRYLYTEKFKGATQSSSNVIINKENADEILSLYLYENGYARIPVETRSIKLLAPEIFATKPTPIILLKRVT